MITFEEYIGKEVEVVQYDSQGIGIPKRRTGIVVGCDLWVGVTIVAKDNPDMVLKCVLGESSSKETMQKVNPGRVLNDDDMEDFRSYAIEGVIEVIKEVAVGKVELNPRYDGMSPSKDTCPFNQ